MAKGKVRGEGSGPQKEKGEGEGGSWGRRVLG